MKGKRVILEMGSGNDLHGGDYTKAAVRAVEDAIHHSSLTFIRTLGIDLIGLLDADRDLDLHRVDWQPNSISDAEPVVPERVAQGAHGRLRVICSADIGAHADLEHHTPQAHFRLSYALLSDRSRCARG